MMQLNWLGEKENEYICDPNHKDSILQVLPQPTQLNCKGCGVG